MIVMTADIEDDVEPREISRAYREIVEEKRKEARQVRAIRGGNFDDRGLWTRNFVPMLLFMFFSLFSKAQYCEGKEPQIIINTSCHEVCVPGTYKIDTSFCAHFMMTAVGATNYTWTLQGSPVATTNTLYFYPSVPGVTNYIVTGEVFYFGRPCYGQAVISITTVACTHTIDFTTGLPEYQRTPAAPFYFDLYGRKVERRYNELLIQQVGLKRKKIIIIN